MKRLNERRAAEFELEGSADAGFTLIELMVVLLILAILLAIAIPTFLGVTGGANDRAAQSNINTALTTAKAAETQNNQTYTGINAASLHANEPSITFVDGGTAVTTPGPVSVYVDTAGNGIVLAGFSKSTNTCWFATDNIAFVVGVASPTNGMYTDTTVTPGVTHSTTSAPTASGTYYGTAGPNHGTGCDAKSAPTAAKWGTSYNNMA
jgi:type IV pilus assembly protein PilA